MQDITQDNLSPSNSHAVELNRQCFCVTLDREALNNNLRKQLGDTKNAEKTVPELLHLFSNTPVFVPKTDIATMERIVQAIESAIELPQYREKVLF